MSDAPAANGAPPKNIGDELTQFLNGIESLKTSFPLVTAAVSIVSVACIKDMIDFLKARGLKLPPEDGGHSGFVIGQEHQSEFEKLAGHLERTSAGQSIIPEHFVVALVSQFDAFLGNVLRILFRAKPDRMHNSKKTFTYSQLHQFKDIESIKEHMLEKRIEQILRSSHATQIDRMEHCFMAEKEKKGKEKSENKKPEKEKNTAPEKGTLRKNLPIWPVFIELTERRNLLVHCRGHVSQQYLDVCDKHAVAFSPRPAVGERLGVTLDYFTCAHACIYELAAKLAHVLWRKILPDDRRTADEHLAQIIYDLVMAERHSLAIVMGEFATGETIKKWYNDNVRRRIIVNLAQAYKWNGHEDKAERILKQVDWSASRVEFELAVAVLQDNNPAAFAIMRQIGPNGFPSATEYRDWPLFKKIRETDDFLHVYRTIFGRDFQPLIKTGTEKLFADEVWNLLSSKLGIKPPTGAPALPEQSDNVTADQAGAAPG